MVAATQAALALIAAHVRPTTRLDDSRNASPESADHKEGDEHESHGFAPGFAPSRAANVGLVAQFFWDMHGLHLNARAA